MQIHWWNYDIPGNVEVALTLKELQKEGKIHQIGATNYDVKHVKEMVDAGVDIVSHTVQYSLLDRRPENGMVDLFERIFYASMLCGTDFEVCDCCHT